MFDEHDYLMNCKLKYAMQFLPKIEQFIDDDVSAQRPVYEGNVIPFPMVMK
jgi:hypothetical protein